MNLTTTITSFLLAPIFSHAALVTIPSDLNATTGTPGIGTPVDPSTSATASYLTDVMTATATGSSDAGAATLRTQTLINASTQLISFNTITANSTTEAPALGVLQTWEATLKLDSLGVSFASNTAYQLTFTLDAFGFIPTQSYSASVAGTDVSGGTTSVGGGSIFDGDLGEEGTVDLVVDFSTLASPADVIVTFSGSSTAGVPAGLNGATGIYEMSGISVSAVPELGTLGLSGMLICGGLLSRRRASA